MKAAPAADLWQSGRQLPRSADWLRLAHLARALSWITLAWMAIEGGVAIAAAVVAGSVALLGFGLDSGIEAMASIIVIWRFTGTRLTCPASERLSTGSPRPSSPAGSGRSPIPPGSRSSHSWPDGPGR